MVQKKLVTKSLKACAYQLKKHLKIHHAVEYKILETMEEERKPSQLSSETDITEIMNIANILSTVSDN